MWIRVWVLIVAFVGLLHGSGMSAGAAEKPLRVYIGTYTGPRSQGIYTAEFEPVTGKLSNLQLAANSRNPTFLALDPKRPILYAAEEIGDFGVKHEGDVSAFQIDPSTGKISLLNQQPSGGSGPCHLCVDKTGSCVLVANYNSGSVASFPIEESGRLAPASSVIQHHGSSINRDRQSGPHAHFITTDPRNRIAFTCDLGLDKVLGYRLAPQGKPVRLELITNNQSLTTSRGG